MTVLLNSDPTVAYVSRIPTNAADGDWSGGPDAVRHERIRSGGQIRVRAGDPGVLR
jgi:hypothetical protein